jgi:two-component system, OmpR family, response regulator RegX3
MSKLLLIEDEESFGEALKYQLEREGYQVDWSTDGTSGLDSFRTAGADLVLLDLMLPGMGGEDICKEIRRISMVPIIMLTAKDTEVDKVLGLELGADDYVTKPFSARELVARVKAVLRRSTSIDSSEDGVLEGGGIRLDPSRFEVTVQGEPVHLPRKEFELLELLMENSGRVLSRETLIDRVWGSDYFGDSRTLDVHIKRLRAKCEPDPHEPRHLITIRGLGYKFVP